MSRKYLTVQVRCSRDFMEKVDKAIEECGYASRSEAVRKFFRSLLEENRVEEKETQ